MQSPCFGCKERIVPTKDNPQTCHGHCQAEAEYISIMDGKKECLKKLGKEDHDVHIVWKSRKKRIYKSRKNV